MPSFIQKGRKILVWPQETNMIACQSLQVVQIPLKIVDLKSIVQKNPWESQCLKLKRAGPSTHYYYYCYTTGCSQNSKFLDEHHSWTTLISPSNFNPQFKPFTVHKPNSQPQQINKYLTDCKICSKPQTFHDKAHFHKNRRFIDCITQISHEITFYKLMNLTFKVIKNFS